MGQLKLIALASCVIFSVTTSTGLAADRNPYDVQDVVEPFDANAAEFRDTIVNEVLSRRPGPDITRRLDGTDWIARWQGTHQDSNAWYGGPAHIEYENGTYFLIYADTGERYWSYLIEAKPQERTSGPATGVILWGKYQNLRPGQETASAPWVGILRSDNRIEGYWQTDENDGARPWDFDKR